MSTITRQITRIDNQFEPDPTAIIDVTGRIVGGGVVSLWLGNCGHGPELWPAPFALNPYAPPSVPLLRSVSVAA